MNGTQVAGYSYDDDGRLTTLSTTAGDFGFEYDRLSRRSRIAFPNGVATEYSYDTQSRLTSVQAGGGGVVGTTYVHDAVGNRTSKASASQSEAYSYDASDRLTAVSSAAGTQLFAYDRVGNRLTIQRDGILQRANYDQRNRLTELASGDGSLQVRGTLDEAGAVAVDGKAAAMVGPREFKAQVQVAPGENTLAIDAWDQSGNQITQHYRVTQPSSSSSMEYDPNGNLLKTTQGGPVTQFEWDAENRLIRVSRDGTELARFSYDPLGRRTQKIAGGVTYSFVYDGQDILSETHNDGTTYTYVHGPGIDEPLARLDQSGAVAYYHADGLGSIVATTDASGNVTSRRQYDAWGNLEVGADQAGYAFTGREWDPETGLYYYRARYYDPKIGRFISEDPIGFAGGVNFYGYVDGSPTMHRDPEGTLPIGSKAREFWKAIASLVSLVDGARTDSMGGQEKELETTKELVDILKRGSKAKSGPVPQPRPKMLRPQTHGGRSACRLPRGGASRFMRGAGGLAVNILAIIEGVEADADRELRAQEAGVSYAEQLRRDAYEDNPGGLVVTPLGILPVDALVRTPNII